MAFLFTTFENLMELKSSTSTSSQGSTIIAPRQPRRTPLLSAQPIQQQGIKRRRIAPPGGHPHRAAMRFLASIPRIVDGDAEYLHRQRLVSEGEVDRNRVVQRRRGLLYQADPFCAARGFENNCLTE